MNLLILSALFSETSPLIRKFRAEKVFRDKKNGLFRKIFPGLLIHFGVTGEGNKNVRKFFKRYFPLPETSHHLPDLVISTGFAGAVNPGLRVGEMVSATRVIDEKTNESFPLKVEPPLKNISIPGICCSVYGFRGQDAKKELLQKGTRADFVDMESAPVAEICRDRNISLWILRAVSDTADFNFPDLELIQDSWKRIPKLKLALSIFTKPSNWIRTIRLLFNVARARRSIYKTMVNLIYHFLEDR